MLRIWTSLNFCCLVKSYIPVSFSSNVIKKHLLEWYLTLSQTKILDTSKLKEFADDNFKFDENGRKLSKQVENTVGKGEIACYEQFILFPQCFQKTFTADK